MLFSAHNLTKANEDIRFFLTFVAKFELFEQKQNLKSFYFETIDLIQ